MGLHVLLFSFVSFLLLSQNLGIGEIWKLSKEEDLELEKQLNLLNKPAIKSILTEDGYIYDCVDFYQQPAFDHPLLKNHSYSYETETISNEEEELEASEFGLDFGLNGEECPHGTVIIKRLSKHDLIREKIVANKRWTSNGRIHYAGSRTDYGQPRYAGAGGRIAIYNPYVNGIQASSARIVVQNGLFDSISVGWTVDPRLHYDKRTHIFIRTDVGADTPTHCFDTRCPAFIVTSRKYPLGGYFTKISKRGGPNYVLPIDILRDQNGDWKLRLGNYDKIHLGFWPKNIFSQSGGLADLANHIEWGGEVFSEYAYRKPPMGIGSFPNNNPLESSYISRVTYRDENSQKMNAVDAVPYADLDQEFKVIDVPFFNSDVEHIIFYGGPGGLM